MRTLLLLLVLASLAGGQSREPTHRIPPPANPAGPGGFGSAVHGLPDIDGDGYADHAVQAPFWNVGGVVRGRVFVHSGRDGRPILVLDGPGPGPTGFGRSVVAIGDVDGDGRVDLAIGAPGHDTPELTDTGRVSAHSGATGTLLWETVGDAPAGRLGETLATTPAHAAGALHLVVGEPGRPANGLIAAGAVTYLDPASGTLLGRDEGAIFLDRMGSSLAARPDLPGIRAGSADGRVWACDGPGGPSLATLLLPPHGGPNAPPELALVARPGAAGPVLVVGRPLFDAPGRPDCGELRALPASAAPGPWNRQGSAPGEALGLQVIAVRDLDGDGEEEVGVASRAPFSVRFQVLDAAGNTADEVEYPHAGGDRASLPDVTGDGRGEWLAGVADATTGVHEVHLFTSGLGPALLAPGLPGGPSVFVQEIDLGSGNAGAPYLVAFGVTGTWPPLLTSSSLPAIPLVVDAVTAEALSLAGGPALPSAIGFLDASGGATSTIVLPTPPSGSLGGLTLFDVCVALDLAGRPAIVSNPRRIDLP